MLRTNTKEKEQLQEHQQDKQLEQLVGLDPLAQTFLIDDEGGVFLTSVDLFFKTKDR